MHKILLLSTLLLIGSSSFSQSIKDLDFLTGEWKVKEDNSENDWWEKSTRTVQYALDSTYIVLEASAISSSGKERTYLWYIHHNSKKNQFEMVSMFSNWHKAQFDILIWEPKERKLIIKNGTDPNADEYHERYGEMVFNEDFDEYVWIGENKYGDRNNPSIWKYVEKGWRSK